jgi:hypothetical protein
MEVAIGEESRQKQLLKNFHESYNCQASCRMRGMGPDIDRALLLILFVCQGLGATAYKDVERQLCLMESNDGLSLLVSLSWEGGWVWAVFKSSPGNCNAWQEWKTTRQWC